MYPVDLLQYLMVQKVTNLIRKDPEQTSKHGQWIGRGNYSFQIFDKNNGMKCSSHFRRY